jgi:hypothetical protein
MIYQSTQEWHSTPKSLRLTREAEIQLHPIQLPLLKCLFSAREATDLEQVGVGDGRFGQRECWGGD